MCLSAVYKDSFAEENLLCRNIADVKFKDGKLVLTDLMGIQKIVDATIDHVDLLENYIIIKGTRSF